MNPISKFQKGKATLDNLLESQKFQGDIQGIGYENRTFPSSSSHINFIKAHDSTDSTFKNENQAFKAKRSHVSNNRGRSHKTQPPLTQRGKAQTRAPQPKHAYMYTRHNYDRYVTQHNAHKHVAQTYQNTHCHCQCMSHTMTQKSYRNNS